MSLFFRVFNGNLAPLMINNSTNSLNFDKGVHHVAVCMERSHIVHDLIEVPGFDEVDIGLGIHLPRGKILELY